MTTALAGLVLAVLAVPGDAVLQPHGHVCNPGDPGFHLPFCDTKLTPEARAFDLVARLTLDEKTHLIAVRGDSADAGVARLGIPQYDWGIEILHGAGINCIGDHCPTIFPVLANVAATFNRTAMRAMGSAISTEMRASNNANGIVRPGSSRYAPVGLNGWGPNINLQRDPRWGRSIEVPTEDPILAGKVGAEMTRGIQEGNDPRYVKLLGALKHFSVYSMESSAHATRQGFAPNVSRHDMVDSYLPGFRIGIEEGGALGMMCSYTSINGTDFCESVEFQQQWARHKHGFEGNIYSDCTALSMPLPSNEGKMNAAHNAAAGLAAGTDINCGNGFDGKLHGYTAVPLAVAEHLVTQEQLDTVVRRSIALRIRTGSWDPLEGQLYGNIPLDMLGADAHHDLAEDIAAQGLVLLENNGVLPLTKGRKTAVVGPHAHADRQLLGSYFTMACPLPKTCPMVPRCNSTNCNGCCDHGSDGLCCSGTDSQYCAHSWTCSQTPAAAISTISGVGVVTALGCTNGVDCSDEQLFGAAVAAAKSADQVVVMLGIDSNIESEGCDRTTTMLPGKQEDLALQLLALEKPTVIVLLNGGIVSIDRIAKACGGGGASCAVVEAFYPGIRGASALAKSLFGVPGFNRWGKLPVTVYDASFSDSVDMLDMSFTSGLGRTYRYWTGPTPLWTFGHGLSLTIFGLNWAPNDEFGAADADADEKTTSVTALNQTLELNVQVSNSGARDGDEVVMLYHVPSVNVDRPGSQATLPLPHRRLLDFSRVTVGAGATGDVTFSVNVTALGLVDTEGNTYLYAGNHSLVVDRGHGDTLTLKAKVAVPGAPLLLDTMLGAEH